MVLYCFSKGSLTGDDPGLRFGLGWRCAEGLVLPLMRDSQLAAWFDLGRDNLTPVTTITEKGAYPKLETTEPTRSVASRSGSSNRWLYRAVVWV